MAENVLSRKQTLWMSVSVAPDVCKTPMGGSTPPVPYPVVSKLETAKDASPNVHANDALVQKHDKTIMPTTEGDEPGTAKGVKSGTVGQQSWSQEHSPNVNVNDKPVVRHDDKTEMNGDKKGQDKADKAARHKCRKEQVEAGKKSDDPETRKAAERFDKNIKGAEMGRLSNDVYDPEKGGPTGWKNISNDPEALARHGISPDQLTGPGAYRAQAYEPDPAVFGNDSSMRPTVAFQGTTGLFNGDMGANLGQGTGWGSQYYNQAVGIGNSVHAAGGQVDFTGHSLGGGLASAASQASGLPGTTFNAAGLNSSTVPNARGDGSQIDAYRVDNEILTGAQEQGWKSTVAFGLSKVLLGAAMPNAVGKKIDLPGESWSPLTRHKMGEVQKGLEKKKKEDQDKIAAKTGKKC